MAGFQHLEDVFKAGYLNEDFGVAKFDDGVRMVATGEAAHYPMLTFALGNIKQNFPDNLERRGLLRPARRRCREERSDRLDALRRCTSRAASENAEAAKAFLAFVASVEGCNIMIDANGATGPYPDQGLRAACRRARRRSPTCCPTSRPKA